MKKVFLFLVLCVSAFTFFCFDVSAATLVEGAKSAVLMESNSGELLFEKNKDEQRAPASMTKIMTLLLIYDAIDAGTLKKTDLVTGSEHAKSMGGSQVYLEVGEQLSVDDMLKCICIASANDCAVAMAEHIFGSEEEFVNKMNERAKELGCENTNFLDATGLSGGEHFSSSYDIALISRELITCHPDVLEYTSIKEDYIRKESDSPFWLVNTNKILGHLDGLKGLKTGFTDEAKYCITLVMEKDDMTLISVVMGYDSSHIRNAESVSLLKYGFANYERVKIVEKGTIYSIFKNIKYTPVENNVVSDEDLFILQKKIDPVDYEVKFSYEINDSNLSGSIGRVGVYDLNGNLLVEGNLVLQLEAKKNSIWDILLIVIEKIFG